MSVTAYIALGSNLGERRAFLDRALARLREQPGMAVSQVSSYHETAPVGGPSGQGPYLNAAAAIATERNPSGLLQALMAVEQELGRVRGERYGPRTIDLDLLLYGDQVRQEPGLLVPHPRLHERSFVLEPLAEIAPLAVHPILGRTVQELAQQLRAAPGWEAAEPGRPLAGLRVLVTGSTSGIGRAMALRLAGAGARVIVHGRRREAAEAITAIVQALQGSAAFLLADLRRPEEWARLVQEAWEVWDGLDAWINNAGADTLTGPPAHWPFERKLEELLAVDVQASLALCRAVGGRMKVQGHGVLLTMGWDQAETGMEGDSGQLFGATKGAVMAFTRSLALTLAPEVRVNCLAPGWIRTAWGEAASSHWQERVRRETPLARWGVPDDVAVAACWLLSPAAAFITGQVVRINGGAIR